jgi:hypothetical protein
MRRIKSVVPLKLRLKPPLVLCFNAATTFYVSIENSRGEFQPTGSYGFAPTAALLKEFTAAY